MKEPNVWVVTTGRSGSTALMVLLRALGVDVIGKADPSNHGTEHDNLVASNEIIMKALWGPGIKIHDWFYKPMPDNWKYWLYEMEHEDAAEKLDYILTLCPKVLKDPRWSVTLPIWERYCSVRPEHIISLERETDQCVQSWILGREHLYEQGKNAVNMKKENLHATLCRYEVTGTKVHRFTYPEIYLAETERLAVLLAEIFDLDIDFVRFKIDKVVDKARIHEYSLNTKSGNFAKSYSKKGEEHFYAVFDMRPRTKEQEEAEENITEEEKARRRATRNMFEDIGEADQAGIRQGFN